MSNDIYTGLALPVSVEKILHQAASHAKESHDYIALKRPLWDKVRRLYREYQRDPFAPNFRGTDMFTVIDMFKATDRSDQQVLSFVSVDDNPANKDKAQYLTNNWINDFKQGKYADAEDDMKMNMYITGMGCLYFNGWDRQKLLPSMVSVPTDNLLLDPVGGADPQNHRWVGFAMRYNLAEMVADRKNFIPAVVEQYLRDPQPTRDAYTEELDTELNEMAGMTNEVRDGERIEPEEEKQTPELGVVDVYDMFITIHDKRFFITTDQQFTHLFRFQEMKPIAPSGRHSVRDILYPVVFRQFMPVYKNDPIGIAPYELISHDQINKSTLINLAKEKVYKNLSNAMMVKAGSVTADQLEHDRNEVTEVTLRDGERMGDVVAHAPVSPTPLNEILALIDLLEKQIADNTGVNATALGNPEQGAETLGELQIRSQNLNTRNRKRLTESINTRIKEAELWIVQYQRFFRAAGARKKTIQIQIGDARMPYTITPRDFNGDIPNIIVKSTVLEQQDNQQKIKGLYATLNGLQMLGDREAIANVLKEILLLEGAVEEEEVGKFVPENPVVKQIEMENEVLAENIELELLPTDDVLLRLRYQRDIPSDAGRKRYEDLLARAAELQLEEQLAAQEQLVGQQEQAGPGTEVRLGEMEKEEMNRVPVA